ncbi:MAG TPA: ATP-binding cassette domain-containing protein, partial [Stellaceae bacterium]
MPELLQFRAVDTYYGDLHVLKAVDYRIEEGEIVCLLGSNGAGKSTTMKTIMGIVLPSRGDIIFEG